MHPLSKLFGIARRYKKFYDPAQTFAYFPRIRATGMAVDTINQQIGCLAYALPLLVGEWFPTLLKIGDDGRRKFLRQRRKILWTRT
jgi:hypothetical protein